ncbi:hypothetical protein BDR22DRAFT_239521 [Usnea florida]
MLNPAKGSPPLKARRLLKDQEEEEQEEEEEEKEEEEEEEEDHNDTVEAMLAELPPPLVTITRLFHSRARPQQRRQRRLLKARPLQTAGRIVGRPQRPQKEERKYCLLPRCYYEGKECGGTRRLHPTIKGDRGSNIVLQSLIAEEYTIYWAKLIHKKGSGLTKE